MNSKYLFTIIAIVVVLIAGFLLMNQTSAPTEISNQNSSVSNANTEDALSNANNDSVNNAAPTTNSNQDDMRGPQSQEPTEPDGNDVAVFEIVFDGKVFNPSQLTIKAGDVVVFKNESSGSFWPASGPHPEHTLYPEFDPKKAIGAGQSWQFKFTKTGTWGFHNHMYSTATGKIIVE